MESWSLPGGATLSVNKPYYQIIRDVLAANILSGRMPAGLRLSASAVADRLGVSRPPVKRALQLLERENLVRPLPDQGYVIGRDGEAPTSRLNLHKLELELPERLATSLVQPSWERIFEGVEQDILSCMPFGAYQISEAGLGDHFKVSRTVIRDVLSRMHARGLIHKDRSSHWIAGPLSARMLDEAHEIRRLLEPNALSAATALLEPAELAAMRKRVRAALDSGSKISQETIDVLEGDLHGACIEKVRNRRLANTIRDVQLSLVVNRQFGIYIGFHDETAMLMEHRLVFDHLIIGDGQGASAALRHHLDADHERTRARLKVLSVFSEPETAPYLIRIH